MRQGEAAFVDSGAWIALAMSRDPLHRQAREQWDVLHAAGAKLRTSLPVVIETFIFLDRLGRRFAGLVLTGMFARKPHPGRRSIRD